MQSYFTELAIGIVIGLCVLVFLLFIAPDEEPDNVEDLGPLDGCECGFCRSLRSAGRPPVDVLSGESDG